MLNAPRTPCSKRYNLNSLEFVFVIVKYGVWVAPKARKKRSMGSMGSIIETLKIEASTYRCRKLCSFPHAQRRLFQIVAEKIVDLIQGDNLKIPRKQSPEREYREICVLELDILRH